MPDPDEKLTPADPRDVETAPALALTSGKAMARSQAAETMSRIVAERLVALRQICAASSTYHRSQPVEIRKASGPR
jgi:hypothetical protein